MKTERAQAGTRTRISSADRRTYKGIGQHPLARKWMFERLIEARENAAASKTEAELRRWSDEAERVSAEMRRCGVLLGEEA